MDNSDFAARFARLRKSSRLTQSRLGELLGVTNRAVSKWERGTALPSTDNVARLAAIFDCSTDFLLAGHYGSAQTQAGHIVHGMKPLSDLYRIGHGPSSSHTMGPERACRMFREKNPDADSFRVILFGSLARTGSFHGTAQAIKNALAPHECEVVTELGAGSNGDGRFPKPTHPNTFDIIAFSGAEEIKRVRVISSGGGRVECAEYPDFDAPDIYPVSSFEAIAAECRRRDIRLWQYVELIEGETIWDTLAEVWRAMKRSIAAGLSDDGILPGGLGVQKKARQLSARQHIDESSETRENRMVCAYAFAVSEQNASSGRVVTAPTCGASGVVPAVLYYQQQKRGSSDTEILHALAAGGLIGNLIKANASISGSECGCQAEIGTACAMASAALAELYGLDLDKLECAAEIAIEHHLGLTCDPIGGLTQIPCIERNAVAAMRAINAVNLASFLADSRKITLDKVIEVMRETGLDISSRYKETSEGGLARISIVPQD